jgi:hypothetical protein
MSDMAIWRSMKRSEIRQYSSLCLANLLSSFALNRTPRKQIYVLLRYIGNHHVEPAQFS